MRKTLIFTAGAVTGYLLGARAGRPAYDRITSGWFRTSDAVGLTDLGRTVARSAVDLRETATERATTEVHDLVARAADAVSPGHGAAENGSDRGGATGSSDDAQHGTIVAPTPAPGR